MTADNRSIKYQSHGLVMAVQADARGFIIGEKRLKEMADGINQTEGNTKQILSVLGDKLDELRKQSEQANQRQTEALDRQNRSGRSSSASDVVSDTVRRSVDASSEALEGATRVLTEINNEQRANSNRSSSTAGGASSVQDRVERQRDSKGRFTGSGSSSSADNPLSESGSLGSFFSRIKSFFPISGSTDTGGLDPTVDAVKELTNFVSPVGRVFGGMGARAVSVFRGRAKKRRNDEVLPDEQVQANDNQERSDRQRNKLLQRLINAVSMGGSGRGGGLLGGLFGRGAGRGGLLKGLLRKVPILGAILGGGMVAGNWNNSNSGEKGKGIGSLVGMGIGGALGSFLGIGGTMAGGALGSYLGGIFGKKVGEWTETLKDQDLGKVFKDFLSGALDLGKSGLKMPFGAVGVASSMFGSFAKNMASTSGAFGGAGGADLPKATKTGQLSFDKAQSISRVANNIGVDPDDLASIISFETGGTFSPSAKNPHSSGTGLIQKMGDGATKRGGYNDGKYYGMSRDKYASLSFDEQMNYVERYYKERGFDGKRKRSLADAYTAVTGYGYKKGTEAYDKNKVWDTNKNDVIDKDEAVRSPAFQVHRKVWVPETIAPALPNAKGDSKTNNVIKAQKSAPSAIQVPVIKPELSKMKPQVTASSSKAPSDTGISQIVSDRSLAHVFAGSIGFDNHSA